MNDFVNTDIGHVYRTGAVQSERLKTAESRAAIAAFVAGGPTPYIDGAHASSGFGFEDEKPGRHVPWHENETARVIGALFVAFAVVVGIAACAALLP